MSNRKVDSSLTSGISQHQILHILSGRFYFRVFAKDRGIFLRSCVSVNGEKNLLQSILTYEILRNFQNRVVDRRDAKIPMDLVSSFGSPVAAELKMFGQEILGRYYSNI